MVCVCVLTRRDKQNHNIKQMTWGNPFKKEQMMSKSQEEVTWTDENEQGRRHNKLCQQKISLKIFWTKLCLSNHHARKWLSDWLWVDKKFDPLRRESLKSKCSKPSTDRKSDNFLSGGHQARDRERDFGIPKTASTVSTIEKGEQGRELRSNIQGMRRRRRRRKRRRCD